MKYAIIILLFIVLGCSSTKPIIQEHVHIKKNDVTDVITLKRGNQQILLVGVKHVGSIKYYKQIQSILDTCSTVLYEGIDLGDEKSVEYEEASKTLKESYEKIDDSTIVYQADYIEYSDDWYLSDLNSDDMVAIFNSKSWYLDVMKNSLYDPKIYNAVIILRNNKTVLYSIRLLGKHHNNITILYGNLHLKHFIEEFSKLGFVVAKEEEITL